MRAADIALVRKFNRTVTRRVGALDGDYLARGRPLGEARLLFEIGARGAAVRDLRARLGLDSGYLARLAMSLKRQGLVVSRRDPDDARRSRLVLTRKGEREVAAYDRLSDDLARSFLAPLDPARRARLLAAMTEVETLLGVATLDIRAEPPESPDSRACVAAYFAELDRRFEGGFDPGTKGYSDPKDAGTFYLARRERRPIACGAVKRIDAATFEIKRMWVSPDARGQGVAKALLAALEAEAARLGAKRIVLDTNKALLEAHALYRKAGYREIARFNDNPYAHLWFEKRLSAR